MKPLLVKNEQWWCMVGGSYRNGLVLTMALMITHFPDPPAGGQGWGLYGQRDQRCATQHESCTDALAAQRSVLQPAKATSRYSHGFNIELLTIRHTVNNEKKTGHYLFTLSISKPYSYKNEVNTIIAEYVFPFNCTTFPLFFYEKVLDRCLWPLRLRFLQSFARHCVLKLWCSR